jgi:hypothetical protein
MSSNQQVENTTKNRKQHNGNNPRDFVGWIASAIEYHDNHNNTDCNTGNIKVPEEIIESQDENDEYG